MKFAFMLGCLLLCAGEMRGQDAPKDLKALQILPQPLPSGNLLSQAPDSARWTVTAIAATKASSAARPNPPAPKPTVFTITKSGKLYLVESVGPDGRKMVRWKDHQYQATYVPGAAQPLIAYGPSFLVDGSVLYYIDFSKADFPEFTWIAAGNYVGMTRLGGDAMGLVFKGRVATKGLQMPLLTGTHPDRADAIAVVDSKTQRPLMLQVDDELLLYQFSDGAAQVSLPPEVQLAFDSLRKLIKRATAVPPG
jgi:hypothetical protein